MTWPLIIITILGGLILVALEIVALPGAVCGIVGGAMVALAIWQTYTNYGSTATLEDVEDTPVLIPSELEELRKKMKARYFFVYPSRPVNPYEIRLYFYIVVEKETDHE